MRWRLCSLLPAVLLSMTGPATADSIWQRHTREGGFLFVDNRARQVGDLLTIVIQENTGIDFNETRDASKATSTGGVFNLAGTTSGNINSKQVNAAVNASGGSTRTLNGTSQYTSGRSFADRMTVTVMAVLENGNLVIEGETVRVVSGETRTLKICGVVRPIDIGSNNTVASPSIAHLHCTYTGKGQESHFTSYGWLNQYLIKIWPF